MNWVVLLRGVNVGRKGRLPMKALCGRLIASFFCTKVETYIQSGNLLLESDIRDATELNEAISILIQENFGFTPQVCSMSISRFREIAANNPYPQAESEPKTLHLFFPQSTPREPDIATLESKRSESESFLFLDGVAYLHAPDGIGRSKLAAAVEKAVGVPVTARNWNTVRNLLSMLS